MTWQPYIHIISTLKSCHVPAGQVCIFDHSRWLIVHLLVWCCLWLLSLWCLHGECVFLRLGCCWVLLLFSSFSQLCHFCEWHTVLHLARLCCGLWSHQEMRYTGSLLCSFSCGLLCCLGWRYDLLWIYLLVLLRGLRWCWFHALCGCSPVFQQFTAIACKGDASFWATLAFVDSDWVFLLPLCWDGFPGVYLFHSMEEYLLCDLIGFNVYLVGDSVWSSAFNAFECLYALVEFFQGEGGGGGGGAWVCVLYLLCISVSLWLACFALSGFCGWVCLCIWGWLGFCCCILCYCCSCWWFSCGCWWWNWGWYSDCCHHGECTIISDLPLGGRNIMYRDKCPFIKMGRMVSTIPREYSDKYVPYLSGFYTFFW